MNRFVRITLVLLLVLGIGVLAALVAVRFYERPWIPWLSRTSPTVNLGDGMTPAAARKQVETPDAAKALALAAVIADQIGRSGFGGGTVEEVAFDDDPRNAYAAYACTLGTFADGSHWLLTVPIVVKTSYIDYRTSCLVKVNVLDGRILQLTRAVGYRRVY